MVKKIIIGLVCLIVLIGAGAFLLMSNLDGIIKSAVEKYGSAATQASVQLDTVKLTLASGEGQLGGLTVTNPKGFSTPKAFYLGSIRVQVDTSSIKGSGPIVIKDITIDQPQVTYELLNNGSSNLQAIINNTQAYARSFQKGGDEQAEAEPAPADKSGGGRKIIITNLLIKGGQVSISQELLQGKQLSAPLPDIHLSNIGKDSGGANAAQIAQQVIDSIANEAAQASVTELAKEKLNGLINAVPAGAIGGAAVDTIGNKVKGIFGQ